jgi:hypothetical protein
MIVASALGAADIPGDAPFRLAIINGKVRG